LSPAGVVVVVVIETDSCGGSQSEIAGLEVSGAT
jgi:hypothetical protein